MNNLLIIGKIGSPYGVLGWNAIFSYTEKKYDIIKYTPWLININELWIKYTIERYKLNKNKILVKIKNINDRNQSKKLTNHTISIQSNQLNKLYGKNYYWKDIIGCQVFNKNNIYVGLVINITRTSKNDILIIQNTQKKEVLIPFIYKSFIKSMYLLEKKIYLNIDNNFIKMMH